MQLLAFSFFDSKAGFFSSPFFYPHRGQALRTAIDLGSDLSTQIGRYPGDFSLYEVGTWDDQSGQFTSIPPVSLGVIAALLPKQAPLPLELEVARPNGSAQPQHQGA
jgi:hypothetical protein